MFLCVCVREKYTLEQDIRDAEEAIRHKSAEVQVREPVHREILCSPYTNSCNLCMNT